MSYLGQTTILQFHVLTVLLFNDFALGRLDCRRGIVTQHGAMPLVLEVENHRKLVHVDYYWKSEYMNMLIQH